MDAITVCLIGVCTVAGVALEAVAAARWRDGRMSLRELWLVSGFAVVVVVMGVAFTGHQHYWHFGFLHIASTLFFIGLPFVLKVFIPDKETHAKAHRVAIWVMGGVMVFFAVFKFAYIKWYGVPLYQVLPLNVCNLVVVLVALRAFVRKPMFDNYILCFGLLGAFMNLIMGSRYGFDQNFYDAVVYESNITHNLYFTFCIYALISGEIVPNVKASLKNLVWLAPLFFVYVFTNQIWQFNFFYTGIYQNPVLGLYNLFPTFDVHWFGATFELNPVYYVVVLGLSALVLLLLTMALAKVAPGGRGARTH